MGQPLFCNMFRLLRNVLREQFSDFFYRPTNQLFAAFVADMSGGNVCAVMSAFFRLFRRKISEIAIGHLNLENLMRYGTATNLCTIVVEQFERRRRKCYIAETSDMNFRRINVDVLLVDVTSQNTAVNM